MNIRIVTAKIYIADSDLTDEEILGLTNLEYLTPISIETLSEDKITSADHTLIIKTLNSLGIPKKYWTPELVMEIINSRLWDKSVDIRLRYFNELINLLDEEED